MSCLRRGCRASPSHPFPFSFPCLPLILVSPIVSQIAMVASSVLGFPRIGECLCTRSSVFSRARGSSLLLPIGANREIKKAVEAYWGGKLSADELTKVAAEVKKTNWTSLKERGVDVIPR